MNTYLSIFTLSSSVLLLPLFHKKLLPLPKQLRGLVQGFSPLLCPPPATVSQEVDASQLRGFGSKDSASLLCPPLATVSKEVDASPLKVTGVWFKGFCLFTLPSSCHCLTRSWRLSLTVTGVWFKGFCLFTLSSFCHCFTRSWPLSLNSYGGLVQRILLLYSLLLPLFQKKLTALSTVEMVWFKGLELPLYSVLLLPLFHKKLTPLPKQLLVFGSKDLVANTSVLPRAMKL